MLISGCEDGLIKSWNVQNYEPLKIIKNDNFPFVKIKTAKKNNENYIIHDQDKNTICVWNLKTGQNVLQITNFGELVRSFDICERESKIAITWNNFIRLIDF